MIKAVIVDDELNARDFLEKMLLKYFPNRFLICDKCESVDDAVIAIDKYNPELIFLDIQMPNKNGFELFKEVKTINFEVIFTTAHAEFAIEAIKLSALDYLLKPINYIDLLDTVKRFDKKVDKASQQDKLRLLLENIDTGDVVYQKVAFPTDEGFELVKLNSIMYCEAQSNYCRIFCVNGNDFIISKTLKYVEELLPATIFHRIHKSYLVNINYVVRFSKINEYLVELNNGKNLPVSVRQKEDFINAVVKKN